MQEFDGFPALLTTGVKGRTLIHRVLSQARTFLIGGPGRGASL